MSKIDAMSTRAAALLAVGLLVGPVVSAQSKPAEVGNLTFDAASVKPNNTGRPGGGFNGAGGRWSMVNIPASGLILTAYPTKVSELVGAPAWVTSDRYDVEARSTFAPTEEQHRMMLRALLRDRFKLAAHYETQERPIYNLVLARADGRLGPQLHHIDIDCATYKAQTSPSDTPAPPATDPPPCSFAMSGSTTMSIVSGGRTMQSLADSISGLAERPILDRTGLAGYYSFTLESSFNDGVSIFTALQEQLGLKLEPARGPLDILVIDHIERPTED